MGNKKYGTVFTPASLTYASIIDDLRSTGSKYITKLTRAILILARSKQMIHNTTFNRTRSGTKRKRDKLHIKTMETLDTFHRHMKLFIEEYNIKLTKSRLILNSIGWSRSQGLPRLTDAIFLKEVETTFKQMNIFTPELNAMLNVLKCKK